MSEPKLEEIADEMPCTCPGEYHEPLVYVNCARVRALAALREAADAARREEREECIEVVRLEAASWPEMGAAILFKIQGLLDARSRAEEPKPEKP